LNAIPCSKTFVFERPSLFHRAFEARVSMG
jgi:hypothetical protein